jgi:hypothetical protein
MANKRTCRTKALAFQLEQAMNQSIESCAALLYDIPREADMLRDIRRWRIPRPQETLPVLSQGDFHEKTARSA